jgi:DNase/tRNase domain of colicin-like bacteriocin
MRSKKVFDGGGFPMFTSYHDYRLPFKLVGLLHSDHIQFRNAFKDFVKALNDDPGWRRNFNPTQVQGIEASLQTNGPRIRGFVWHHHQDHGVLQLGRVHTNRSASTMSAKDRNPRKRTSSFSKREKMRRKPLSLRNSRSISLRFL